MDYINGKNNGNQVNKTIIKRMVKVLKKFMLVMNKLENKQENLKIIKFLVKEFRYIQMVFKLEILIII